MCSLWYEIMENEIWYGALLSNTIQYANLDDYANLTAE